MNKTDIDNLEQWFQIYVADFYTVDPDFNGAIRLKEEHTMRVRGEIIKLGHALKLSPNDMRLAETVALLHDIGRFKQYAQYGTFSDRRSENHALLGVRQLAINKVLSMCSRNEVRLIVKAIAYHNAAELPLGEDDRTLLFMRLLRDADKLDIWKVVMDHYQRQDNLPDRLIDHGLPDEDFWSPEVLESLEKHEIVRLQNVRTLIDLKLLQIGWVFDLNFIPSLRVVRQRRYIEQIEATLPKSNQIQYALHHVYGYMASVLKEANYLARPNILIGKIHSKFGKD